MKVQAFYEIAIHAAVEAGKILKKGYNTPFKIAYKEGKHNLVTEYDKKSEKFIKDYIHSFFPEHGFIAEESGNEKEKAEFLWVIDPLDGTVNFAHGIPVFSVSIALYHEHLPLLGVIYQPITEELFTAIKGQGAFLNGKKLQVSTTSLLENSIIATGFPYNLSENPSNCINVLMNVLKNGIPIRRLGSAAIDLAYVAAGRFDAFFEVSLQPWDYAAGILIVEEAGGKSSSYEQKDFSALQPSSCIAANQALHKALIIEVNRGK